MNPSLACWHLADCSHFMLHLSLGLVCIAFHSRIKVGALFYPLSSAVSLSLGMAGELFGGCYIFRLLFLDVVTHRCRSAADVRVAVFFISAPVDSLVCVIQNRYPECFCHATPTSTQADLLLFSSPPLLLLSTPTPNSSFGKHGLFALLVSVRDETARLGAAQSRSIGYGSFRV